MAVEEGTPEEVNHDSENRSSPLYRYCNRPAPQLLEVTYEAPPAPTNPVLRGLLLHYAGLLVSSIGAVSGYLWSNAGFTRLRNLPGLHGYQPRFDPTVIPVGPSLADAAHVEASSLSPERRTSSTSGPKGFPSIADYHAAYRSGTTTPLKVAETLLPLVQRGSGSGEQHSTAFIQVQAAALMAAAEASTARWKAGKSLGILDGVPVAIKDEMDVEGYDTTFGSKRVSKPEKTSWGALKLIEAGALVLGKASMHELGTDTTNNNPAYGTPLNPYHAGYYCGGSSGGSAYAVAAGLVPLALGADAGGSIRIPSSFCGIFGLKTTHGRVSRLPTLNAAPTCGVIGPMGANMLDVEIGFRTIAAPDPSHPSSALFRPPSMAPNPPRRKVLGVYKTWWERADPAVRAACEKAIAYFRDTLLYTVVDITIPHLHEGQTAHALTCVTELAEGNPGSTADLQAANKILISVGRHTPAADYLLAQRLREAQMKHLAALFDAHPGLVIVSPTTPLCGWPVALPKDLKYGVSDANMSLRNMEFVWLANFSGCPALQVPVGYAKPSDGKGTVPIGMMGMTKWGKDEDVIAWGYDAEKWLHEALEGGRQRPRNWVSVLGDDKE